MLKNRGIWFIVCFLVMLLGVSASRISEERKLDIKNEYESVFFTEEKNSAAYLSGISLLSLEGEEQGSSGIEYIVGMLGNEYIAVSDESALKNGSLCDLLSEIDKDGTVITFDNVLCNEALAFTKSVTLSGTLSMEEFSLSLSGEHIILDGFSFKGNNASLRIKGGETIGKSGKIDSFGAPAVIVEFLSHSHFVSLDMEISSATAGGAVNCVMGSCEILGGSVKNGYGAAIENSGSLWLSGSPEIKGLNFDVVTDKAVHLSKDGKELLSPMRVMYKNVFSKGSFEALFYGASGSMESRISLYDLTGENIPIKYFEVCEYTDEKNVLAVYLPYSVKFYNGSTLYAVNDFFLGERAPMPKNPEKSGYTFSGWYKDAALSKPYSFGGEENSDFSLYAGFDLTPPEFKVSSLEFTYDGTERLFGFDYLYHPLSDNGQFSFVWYRNGEPIKNSASAIPISYVTDSGEYFCKLTFAYNGDFVTVDTPKVKITVNKMIVDIPLFKALEYSGKAMSPFLEGSALFDYEMPLESEVGIYYVSVRLRDSDNCKWSETESAEVSVPFEILRAENSFLELPVCEDIYEGQAPRVKYKLKFAEGYAEYSEDGIIWSEIIPRTPGKYYLRIVSKDTKNYTGVVSEPIEFTVIKEVCTGIKTDKLPDKTEYVAFETLDLSGAQFTATYNSGRNENVPLSELCVKYKNGSWFEASDSAATVEFLGKTVPVPVKISLAEYDISGIVFDDIEAVYNGLRHTPTCFCDIVGKDGIALGFKLSGGGIDVGIYEITLSFVSESINYKLPEPITAALTVKPLALPVQYSETEFVYDGEPKLPSAVIIGVEGLPLTLTVTGAGTDAGIYTAVASVSDKNYILKNESIEFEILKADFDLSGIVWSADKFTYNGERHSVTVSGLPRGLTLVGYADSGFTDAGIYTAEITVSFDTKNYNSPGKITHIWEIIPAEYDFSDFIFKDTEAVFNGDYHYPAPEGYTPIGYDGIALAYSFSEGAKHVSEGRKAVTVIFESKSKNYNTPAPIIRYVTVLPKPVSIEWGITSFVYNGILQVPCAYSGECEITVKGSGVDAGSYTAAAEPKSSDYKILNPEIPFTISKAENSWLVSPSLSDIYDGEVPSPTAEAIFGKAEWKYYKNTELTELAELPLAVGEYYTVASIPESKNYLALTSLPLKFTVIPIMPEELKIEFSEPLVAMKPLSEFNVNVFYLNNNGSKTLLSPEDYTVIYQNGSSLRASDSKLMIFAGDFSVEIDISVGKSIVALPKIPSVYYDGSIKMPENIENAVYVTDFKGAKDAGEYKIFFTLTDTENYEFWGGVNEAYFTVLKAPITLKVNKNGSSYETVDGMIYGTDKLYEEYYEKDGKIFVKINNPNYDLTVIPREEKSGFVYAILIFIIALVIVLTAIGMYIVFVKTDRKSVIYRYAPGVAENTAKKTEIKESGGDKTPEEAPLKTLMAVDESYANNLLSDSVAKSLITEEDATVETDGKRRYILNLDTISESFAAGETVNINDFKEKGILPKDAKYVKILARGVIDKPIHILANSFSLSAVKMIALTGGSAKRVRSVKRNKQ